MTWRRSLILGLAVVWLVVLSAIVKASVDGLEVPAWGNPIGGSLSPEVAGGTEIGQVFTAPMPGLYSIELVLDRNTATTPTDVIFHVKADPAATTDIWTAAFSSESVESDEPRRFEFEPMVDSEGQSYYFFVESPASVPGDAIAVRYGAEAELQGATAYHEGLPMPGNLQFKTFYSLRTREKIQVLLARIAEGRPYWFGAAGFYVILAMLYIVVLGVFLLLAARTILDEWEGRG
jgi:hypothetical protein